MEKIMKIKAYWRGSHLQLHIKKSDTNDSAFPWSDEICELEGVIDGDKIVLSKVELNG